MRRLYVIAACLSVAGAAHAQLLPNPAVDVSVANPRFASGAGPTVVLDAAHHNFAPGGEIFSRLLTNEGYRVAVLQDRPLDRADFPSRGVLVLANGLAAVNDGQENWVLPNPSAYSPAEIRRVRAWVRRGGSLLIIADHMPFAGGGEALARAFGAEFVNGLAFRPGHGDYFARRDLFRPGSGLGDHEITRGGPGEAPVTQVRTFTGSAFRWPGAIALLTLDPDYKVFLTRRALEVTPVTPAVAGGGLLQAAVNKVGHGRVAIFAEAGMFTSQVVGPNRVVMGFGAEGADQNVRFVRNVMRWLAANDD